MQNSGLNFQAVNPLAVWCSTAVQHMMCHTNLMHQLQRKREESFEGSFVTLNLTIKLSWKVVIAHSDNLLGLTKDSNIWVLSLSRTRCTEFCAAAFYPFPVVCAWKNVWIVTTAICESILIMKTHGQNMGVEGREGVGREWCRKLSFKISPRLV